MPALLEVAPGLRQFRHDPITAPRPRRPRSGPGFVRRALLIIASTAALYGFVSSGARPYVQARRLDEEAVKMNTQIAAARQLNTELTHRVAELQTPVGEQSAARTYGWLLPGEVSIACPAPTGPLSKISDTALSTPPVLTGPGLLVRAVRILEW